jgi:hypothetical protein
MLPTAIRATFAVVGFIAFAFNCRRQDDYPFAILGLVCMHAGLTSILMALG